MIINELFDFILSSTFFNHKIFRNTGFIASPTKKLS